MFSNDLRQVGDSQHEAYCVQDVGLSTAIEASDGIEERVEIWHSYSRGVGLEAIESNLLYIHLNQMSELLYHVMPHCAAWTAQTCVNYSKDANTA